MNGYTHSCTTHTNGKETDDTSPQSENRETDTHVNGNSKDHHTGVVNERIHTFMYNTHTKGKVHGHARLGKSGNEKGKRNG